MIFEQWKWYLNNNSRILFITPLVRFQKYLTFNDISRKCTRVSRPWWSLLWWRFLFWRFLLNIIKIISLLRRLLWRQFSCIWCNVCNSYLNVQIFGQVKWFRHVLAHAYVIACLSRKRLPFDSLLFTVKNITFSGWF